MKDKLFSVSIHDCRVDTFCSGGKGGQNQNKVSSGVRVTHEPSGAVAESRDTRSQLLNKRTAFAKMAASSKFVRWARIEAARRLGAKSPEQIVEAQMAPENIRVETRETGSWCN